MVEGSYLAKLVDLTVNNLILSEVETVAIALPAYTGLLNLSPLTISMISVIGYTSNMPPVLGITSFPNDVDAATTLSYPFNSMSDLTTRATESPYEFWSKGSYATMIELIPGYLLTCSI